MHIAMIVHNSGTRDGRVLREAHYLRAAGHAVTVVGIPEPNASQPQEILADGVRIIRVPWRDAAYRRLYLSLIPKAIPFLVLAVGLGYELIHLLPRLAIWILHTGGGLRRYAATAPLKAVLSTTITLAVALLLVLAVRAGLRDWLAARVSRRAEQELVRRQMIAEKDAGAGRVFPAIRSRIPNWIPDIVLETIAEPLSRVGAWTGNLALYRYRSEELAKVVVGLKPDVVHCHDCIALPAGVVVKKALGIPLVYDAHEIYEAVAARRFGATDYFARVHQRYLPLVDGFIAVNDSAAAYYRLAYPTAPSAFVIRNAPLREHLDAYDGRLHRAAGLPRTQKILLYQGGYTKHRGLTILVQAGRLLPPDWSLAMMGSGPLTDELKRIASGTERVRFVPAVPAHELLSWTQGATAGIVPYEDKMLNHWIATPNKLWEYPNAGVPLIVQPFPEMRRIVETYRCGWLLPQPLSPEGIATVVASLSDEQIVVAHEACRKFTDDDNWDVIYRDRLMDLYRRIESGARESGKSVALAEAGA
jgi:glycosyltransferase involved in cell wall biosynthesis